jgi:hypothetical protein
MSAAHVRDPIAHRFTDRFLEGGLSRGDGNDFRTEKFHARNVEGLAFHVHRAHVNDALATEARSHCRGSDAVLPRAGLGDDTFFSHSLREQDLAERIVDFVRAGVEQIFAL